MSPPKILSLSRKPKRSEEKHFNNRRTSLNVNLSYVSDPSISAGQESPEKTLEQVDSPSTDSQKKRNEKKTNETRIPDEFLDKIKPSFVRLTSTPLPSKYATLLTGNKTPDDESSSKPRRRFSEVSTIILETSMDITEVQGRVDDSASSIPDTQCPDLVENHRPVVIIPDSEPDTIRMSMKVNTSLDSLAVDFDPRKNLTVKNVIETDGGGRKGERNRDKNYRRGSNGRISPDSSNGNEIPTDFLVVTRADIERENSPGSGNSRRMVVINPRNFCEKETRKQNEGNETPGEEENEPPVETPVLKKGIRSARLDYSSDSGSKSSASSSSSPASVSPNKSLGNIYRRIMNLGSNKSKNTAAEEKSIVKKLKKKKKRKLMRLRTSEIVDLSPVSVRLIRPTNDMILGKMLNRGGRRRRNKTAKTKAELGKIRAASLRAVASDESDEIPETEPVPKKEKRVVKIKAKKIVIKRLRDVELRRLVNKNGENPVTNDRSDEDSSDNDFRANSLDDFEPKNDLTQRKTGRIRPKIMIVASGLPFEEKKLIKETIVELGSSKLQRIVSRHTTHVVTNCIRTVNLLRGIIRGCWVVSIDWISKSRGAGKWLDAETYEMKKFSEAVEKNRREKQLFKNAYVSELFLTCGSIHIAEGTSTPVSVLEELIRLSGGRVSPEPEKAKINVGQSGLKETWILDSITHGELQPFERYSRKKLSSN